MDPFIIGLVLEEAIKGGINFNCTEFLAVIFKPAAFGSIFRVKCFFPVIIGPTRGADKITKILVIYCYI